MNTKNSNEIIEWETCAGIPLQKIKKKRIPRVAEAE